MKHIRKYLGIIIAAALAVVFPMNVAASAQEPVVPMEINEETLLSIAAELQEPLKLKAEHLDIYSASPEFTEPGKEAAQIFDREYKKSYILAFDTASILDMVMGEQFVETISRNEILQIMGGHIGNTVFSMCIAQFGNVGVALSSMLSASKSYVADLDREYVILLEYEAPYSLAMNVFATGEHVITGSETVILTEAIPQILEMFSGADISEAAFGNAADVHIDYGNSALYTQESMDEAISVIRETFSGWEGCELHAIRYAGDDCCSEDNVRWMNDLRPGQGYIQCIGFVSDFHSPAEAVWAWEPDKEYTDWQWWLARTEDGSWELLTWGY